MKKLAVVVILIVLGGVALVAARRFTSKPGTQSTTAGQSAWQPSSPDATQRKALAQVACGATPLKDDGKGGLTCPVCPAGSDFAPQPGSGNLPDSASYWILDQAFYGSFTAPGAHEAVVHVNGCESHASGLGGGFLLRQGEGPTGGAWQTVRYLHGLPGTGADGCRALPAAGGRDMLLCRTQDMHQGLASDSVQLIDIGEGGVDPQQDWKAPTLVAVDDDSSNCSEPFQGQKAIHWGSVTGVSLLPPAGADNLPGVRVEVKVGMAPLPSGQNAPCPAEIPQSYQVDFANRGDHLEATGAGAAALRAVVPQYDDMITLGSRVAPGHY